MTSAVGRFKAPLKRLKKSAVSLLNLLLAVLNQQHILLSIPYLAIPKSSKSISNPTVT